MSRPCEKCGVGLYLKFETCLGVLPVLLLNLTPRGGSYPRQLEPYRGEVTSVAVPVNLFGKPEKKTPPPPLKEI